MRADQRGAPLHFGRSRRGQRGQQRARCAARSRSPAAASPSDLASVGDAAAAPRPAPTASYALATCGAERGDQVQPAGEQLRAVLGQVGVPDVQGGQIAAAAGAADLAGQVRRAQQGVALLEHPVVVGAHAGVAGLAGDQQVVEVAAPLGRVAADQRQVLRREQHQPQRAEHVAGPASPASGRAGPGSPCRARSPARPAAPGSSCTTAHRITAALGAGPDQRRVGGDPVAVQGRDVAERLDQVGLADAVAARPARSGRARGRRSTRAYERKSTSSSRRTYTGVGQLSLVDRVAAELVAQRGDRLHRRRVVLPGGEPGEQRAVMTFSGTASRTASSTVHRPSPVSSA